MRLIAAFLVALIAAPAWAGDFSGPSSTLAPGAAASNLGATSCNAIGASACGSSGVLTYTTVQNYGSTGHVGGNEAIIQSSTDQSSAFLGFVKTRSTSKGAGPGTTVQPGDDLGEINANGDDGTNFVSAATDDWTVDAPVSTGIVPTNRGIWLGNGSGTHTLAALWDSHGNQYLRNGYLGIGSRMGYNPPAVYSSIQAPPYPLTIIESGAGTYLGAYVNGTTGGGAQIQAFNGFTCAGAIYAFWFNADSGLGNCAAHEVDVIVNSAKAWAMDGNKHESFGGPAPTLSACGTSPTLSASATDSSGTITVGTGTVTSCSLTFGAGFSATPDCLVSPHNLTLAGAAYVPTANGITFTATSLTSQVLTYRCDGQ